MSFRYNDPVKTRTMTKEWKELEGMPLKIDVNVTRAEALASSYPPNSLAVTTDGGMCLNGVEMGADAADELAVRLDLRGREGADNPGGTYVEITDADYESIDEKRGTIRLGKAFSSGDKWRGGTVLRDNLHVARFTYRKRKVPGLLDKDITYNRPGGTMSVNGLVWPYDRKTEADPNGKGYHDVLRYGRVLSLLTETRETEFPLVPFQLIPLVRSSKQITGGHVVDTRPWDAPYLGPCILASLDGTAARMIGYDRKGKVVWKDSKYLADRRAIVRKAFLVRVTDVLMPGGKVERFWGRKTPIRLILSYVYKETEERTFVAFRIAERA